MNNLLQEIIDNLSSDTPNLNNALWKAKVLLHRFHDEQISSWVNSELNGYPNIKEVPKYRIIHISVRGNFSNAAWQYTDQPLPTQHLEKRIRERFEKNYVTQSIAVIESYIREEKNIVVELEPEYYGLFSKALSSGFHVQRAWGIHSAGSMLQIVTEVRSRLLDFLLELSDKIPNDFEQNNIEEIQKNIREMFANAVFGDNTSIIIGSHNTQNIKNQITANDFESLAEYFRKNSMPENDIWALKSAIEKDSGAPEHSEKKFGKNVRDWLSLMVNKAIESVWDINIAIASSLIVDSLNRYYGWI